MAGASKEKDENKLKQRLSYWLGTYWVDFDNVYMKPKLIHNWPDVKKEHDQVSKIIKNVIKEFKKSAKQDKKDKKESKKSLRQFIEGDELDREMKQIPKLPQAEMPIEDKSGEPKKKLRFNRLNTEEK